MKPSGSTTKIGASRLAGAILAFLFTIAAAQAIAQAVPPALKPPPGNEKMLESHARGFQVYVSVADPASPTHFSWQLKGPSAALFDEDESHGGQLLALHRAGPAGSTEPTWENVRDSSQVVGAKLLGVTVDPTAIPWLLLRASRSDGAFGQFNKVTYIQRIRTVGGLAPTDLPTAAGIERGVSYRAVYVFFKEGNPHR
jgi:hypothetical protein